MRANGTFQTGKWVLGILLASAALAIIQPAVVPLTGGTSMDRALGATYGIQSLRWVQIQVPMEKAIPGVGAQFFKLPAIGLDFVSMDIYLRCAGPGIKVYQNTCSGDPLKRAFLYPPLMAYLFAWTPLVPQLTAIGIWSVAVLAGIFLAVWFLASRIRVPSAGAVSPVVLALAAAAAYPSVFAFDRGNNDVWVLLLYAAAVGAFVKDRFFWVGLLVSLSVMVKLYPAPLAGACLMAALASLAVDRRRAAVWIGGLAAGVLLVAIPLFENYRYLILEHFPKFTERDIIPGSALDHSLKIAYGYPGLVLGVLLWAAAVLVWCRAASGRDRASGRRGRALMCFCYLAALCTYFVPRTESFDYNLITAFPLLVCLAYTAVRPGRAGWWFKCGTLLWTAGIALPRWINASVFGFPERSFSVFLVMQVAGLICLAAHLLFESFGCDIVENHDNSR